MEVSETSKNRFMFKAMNHLTENARESAIEIHEEEGSANFSS
ncbi:MAG: hypothetical protein ACI9NQ_002163 [Paracoccaceae bacterium]|jgi:hypothetical protein